MDKFDRLTNKYKDKKIVIAYSGGIDSLILSVLLNKVSDVLCVFIKFPFISEYSLNNAIKYAKEYNLNLRVIYLNDIIKNDSLRCYYCKKRMFKILNNIKEKEGYDIVVDGTIYDDLSEDRPGLKAKKELSILSPLAEFNITKKDIINKAKSLNIGIPPKETCLLTRFEKDVTLKDIKKVEKLEDFLRKFSNKVIRLRDFGDIAILECEEIEKFFNNREKILNELKKYYKKVCLNLEKYR